MLGQLVSELLAEGGALPPGEGWGGDRGDSPMALGAAAGGTVRSKRVSSSPGIRPHQAARDRHCPFQALEVWASKRGQGQRRQQHWELLNMKILGLHSPQPELG